MATDHELAATVHDILVSNLDREISELKQRNRKLTDIVRNVHAITSVP